MYSLFSYFIELLKKNRRYCYINMILYITVHALQVNVCAYESVGLLQNVGERICIRLRMRSHCIFS